MIEKKTVKETAAGDSVAITVPQELLAEARELVDQLHTLLESNHDATMQVVMEYLGVRGCYFNRGDVSAILDHQVTDEEWEKLWPMLQHWDEHVILCNQPLLHRFIQHTWDEMTAIEGGMEAIKAHGQLSDIAQAVLALNANWKLQGAG